MITLSGIFTLVNSFIENACSPILVTPFGIIISVNWFPENVRSPMLVTLAGIVALVSPIPGAQYASLLPANNLFPSEITGISSMVDGISTVPPVPV